MFTKTTLQRGLTLYTRQSEQFKTVNVSIKWKTALTDEKAANRSVLANVLEESNGQFRTQDAFRRKLDDLYGTVLYTDVAKRGGQHIFTLNLDCVNDEYLQEDDVLEQALSLLNTVVFDPNFVDGTFDDKIVAREKRAVTERIRSQFDNKTSYAQKRMLEEVYPNTPISTSANGSEAAVEAVTVDSLLAAYRSLIEEDVIDIYVVGDIEEAKMIDQLTSLLPFGAREPKGYEVVDVKPVIQAGQPAKDVREQLEMKQGKLHLAFYTPVNFQHEDYFAMQMLNGIYGGFAHSKLFMNVREKESMAYYASSSYASHYGLLYVMSGIDGKLADKAVALIEEQMVAMQKGEISQLEMDQTLALLKNSIRSAFDSARGQIEVFDQYQTLDEQFSPDMLIRKWEAVTKEDLQSLAKQLQLQIVYLLSGKEDASHE